MVNITNPNILMGIAIVLAGFGTWPILSRFSGADALTSSVIITFINLPAFYACQAFWSSRGLSITPREGFLLLGAGIMTCIALWPRLQGLAILQTGALILAGIIGGAGRFKYVELSSDSALPISIIMPILQAGPLIVTALVAFLAAGEKITLKMLASMTVIIVGCVALSLSTIKPKTPPEVPKKGSEKLALQSTKNNKRG
jgi:multidrug transporter EmrE-like cation transporter